MNFKTIAERVKNIALAAFVFGSLGIALGMHYQQGVNAQLTDATKVAYHQTSK